MLARTIRVGGVAAVVCALGVLATPIARRMNREYTLANAIAATAARPGLLPVRLVAPQHLGFVALGRPSRQSVGFAVAAALYDASVDRSPDVQHSAGLASLLAGAPADAARYLSVAAENSTDAIVWTHLAASRYALAIQEKNDEHLLSSLGASSHALELDPKRAEAAYNFALAAERLGVIPAAAELWKNYTELQDSEPWKNDARQRLTAISRQKSASASWTEIVAKEVDDPIELARVTTLYPQQARTWGEGYSLGKWAETAHNEDRAAGAHLGRARVIGRTLLQQTGESLLHEAVAAIDDARSSGDTARMNALVDAHLRHSRGLGLYRAGKLHAARIELERAAKCFTAGKSPMAALAAAFAASVLHDSDRFDDAHKRMTVLLADEDRQGTTHYALRAQLHYQIARADFIRGFWSDSLAASTEALTLYHRIGERGNEGMTASLTAESYDFIGQPAIAIQNGIRAIRLNAEAGDTNRLRVSAANLCRFSMRRGLWDTAHAWIRIERALEHLSADAVLTIDMWMRAAIVEQNLGRVTAADGALRNATAEASRLTDEALRTSLLADIDATSGALAREGDPGRAVALLGEAIAYHERMDRAILLPQLYLERGRAQLGLHRETEALADFERGIAHLERQRGRLHETSMRYGIFDDAHELFTEAMSLHLSRGDQEAAFAVLERGRARALLEQIAGTPAGAFSGPSLAAVRRSMPAETLMIDYAVLEDRVVIFLVAADFVDVREVHIDARTVASKSAAFVESLILRRTREEVQSIASDIYALLIEPVPERSRYERLILVPDAVLQQIPFAALFDRHRRSFLIEEHLLVAVPSAAVFLEGRSHSQKNASAPESAAVFVGARGNASLGLRSLPEAEREAGVVAAIYGRFVLLRGADVTIQRFIEETARHDVVHFAGHALLDAADPAQSALVMAGDGSEPGLLRCRQIGTTRFRKPRIVVLAACSTMRGRTGRSDGTPSIARSFLAAGVPAVVGTLWDVDDGETATLITDFHENLAAGRTPAAALRDAQLRALRGPYPVARHPGSWAAYALLGAGGL